MKILHTSDWHLGKSLEDYSRIAEQEMFIDELCEICEKNKIELIIIAGDIYDTGNPPAIAEKLFYKALLRLSDSGNRKIVVTAGNHDSPVRLSAIAPLVIELGVIVLSTVNTIVPTGEYQNFEILQSGEGFFELYMNKQNVVITNLAYPSEKNIGSFIYDMDDENQNQYSNRIKNIISKLSENFRDDSINIFIGHFYISGGTMEKSERDISLGGSFAVDSDALPENADYIAMGHLHRPQKVPKRKNAFYSGSPIQYDKSEITYPKSVFIADLDKKSNQTERVYLRNYKPIEIWKSYSVEDAIALCEQNKDKDCFVYLEIHTDRILNQSEFKTLKSIKKDIIEINPILSNNTEQEILQYAEEKSIEDEFIEFYNSKRGIKPQEELIKTFLEKLNDLEEGEAL